MNKQILLIISLVLISSGILKAQDTSVVRVYSLDEAINTAKKQQHKSG